tara:strand:- start:55 stop:624 length:570 start_codon:yes stop_codon:yes gene_type:complete
MDTIKFEPLIKEIYKLSKKVSKDLPFHATGIEKQLQEALAYEFRKSKKPIEAVREFFGEIYYKDFPVKDYRPDFVIFPDTKWNLDSTLTIETKFGSLKELASGREELFRYLYSAQQSSSKEIRNSKYGILIWWETISTDTPSGGSKAEKEILLDIETAEYTAPEYKIIVELWVADEEKRRKFKKLISLS